MPGERALPGHKEVPAQRLVSVTRRALPALLALLLSGVAATASANPALPEYRLKAAFLYNFAVFTEWPQAVGPTLGLCVVGGDPFGTDLDELQDKAVGTRKLAVHRRAPTEALADCQIVFIPQTAHAQLPRLTDRLDGAPTLVVTERAGALREGAMVNMNLVGAKVSFEVNLVATRRARLALSARLLKLATEVIQ